MGERSIEVYELPSSTVRCDATTVSGYRENVEIRKEKDIGLEKIYKANDKGETVLVSSGYEFERKLEGKGRRQIREERVLLEGVEKIVEAQRVEGL
ncbi:MAG: hypothetical protein AAB332_06570 [Planctomycetota bacterium]